MNKPSELISNLEHTRSTSLMFFFATLMCFSLFSASIKFILVDFDFFVLFLAITLFMGGAFCIFFALFFLLVKIEFNDNSITQINPIFNANKTITFTTISKYAILKSKGFSFIRVIDQSNNIHDLLFDTNRLKDKFETHMQRLGIPRFTPTSTFAKISFF